MRKLLMTVLIASMCTGCSSEAPPQLSISAVANPVPLNPPEEDWLELNGQEVEFDAEIYWHGKFREIWIDGPCWTVNRSNLNLERLEQKLGRDSKMRARVIGILHKEVAPADYHGQQGGISPVNGYLHWFDAEEIRIIDTVPMRQELD